jgi:hypothetical protein
MKMFRNLLLFFTLLNITTIQAQFTHPMLFEVNAPSTIEGEYNYGPQSGVGWGIVALPSSTVSGQLVWGYDNTPDSLVCDSVTNNYSGKIVMVRRGVCNFSSKILNVQNAGAIGCVICNNQGGTSVINMTAGTFGSQVTIPAVSISEQDCAIIAARLAAGDTVTASFRKPSLYAAKGFYQYETPQNQIQTLDEISVDVMNVTNTIASNIIVSVQITDPYGMSTVLADTIPSLLVDETANLVFSGTYTPAAIGLYEMVFKTSLNNDSIVRSFKIGSNQFTQDEQGVFSWVTIPEASFAAANYRFDIGNVYSTGPNPTTAKKATFALYNGDVYLGQIFQLKLYELPTTITGGEQDYSSFTLVGFSSDTIDVADTADYTLITKPLFDINTLADSIQLLPNRKYMLVASHVGNGSVLQPPYYTYSGTQPLLSYGSTVYSDILYMGGFSSMNHFVLRLETTPSTCTDSIAIFANNSPINTGVNFTLCEGDSLNLTATGSNVFAWNNGVSNGLTFTPTLEGNYSVTGTDTLGCSLTSSFYIDLLQPTSSTISPISCSDYIAPDNAVYTSSGQYTAIIPNAESCDSTISIQLTINNASSSIQTETAIDSYAWPINGQTYTQSGIYTSIITNSAGCDSTITLNLSLNYTGIIETEENSVSIFPNPADNVLYVHSLVELIGELRILDMSGRLLYAQQLSGKEFSIPLDNLTEGSYLLLFDEEKPIRFQKN